MSVLSCLRSWIFKQSDVTHSGLAMAGSLAAVPLLTKLGGSGLAAANLLSISTQLGSQVYVAFVGGPTMFVNMDKTAFGNIQARLFPKFGMVGLSTGIWTLASYHIAHTQPDICTWALLASLSVHILNAFLIFPKTTQFMFQLRQAEKTENTEAISQYRKKFGALHGISNLINFASMGANVFYLYILASRISGVW
eukprot:TRINITY_DN11288_c0_g1_i11.p1 TRINITY_DN11288_c0_g1~~TRINITY_DN11288_c0_g1_i11.p1  ORF type:complete len:195 (+),score=10.56 TRINITY_DN11288_c0_g1_i11:46-630(+)